ncbi:MAG TPA: hypothetical protein VMZ53_08875 [Kofleriaceae bacterium]|nr:hypothetical protein [Kofleriaceae bacterium]
MNRCVGIVAIFVCACGPTTREPAGQPDAATSPDSATVVDTPPPQASGPVDVVITADNAYSFGYGTADTITTFIQGQRAQTAGQIWNCGEGPEQYTVAAADAPDGAYLYVVTWDDLAVTQGVLAQFKRDTGTVLTGDDRFEVCATGLDYSGGANATTGPAQSIVNAEIAKCNAASGDTNTSKGWVSTTGASAGTPSALGRLAVGEANDAAAGTFPIVCQPGQTASPGIDSAAHWMWYDPSDASSSDAFHSTGVNRTKAFLIFRLAAAAIIL